MRTRRKGIGIGFLALGCAAVILPATGSKTLWSAYLFPAGNAIGASPVSLPRPSRSVVALDTASSWFVASARSVGAFFVSVYEAIRDFFVSGQAETMFRTAGNSIRNFTVRICLPLATAVTSLLKRIMPAFSAPPEHVAVWIFWIVAVVVLIVVVLVLRRRRSPREPLPAVSTSSTPAPSPGIEFGVANQEPVSAATFEPAAPAEVTETQTEEPRPKPPISVQEEVSVSPEVQIPEISLEPLGMIGEPNTTPAPPESPAERSIAPLPPEIVAEEAQGVPHETTVQAAAEPVSEPSADNATEETTHEENASHAVSEPSAELTRAAMAQESAVPAEPVAESATPSLTQETSAKPAAETASVSESGERQQTPPEPTEPVSPVPPQETPLVATERLTGADVLSTLSEEAQRFERTMTSPTTPAETVPSAPAPSEPERSSVFAGDVNLDPLIPEGIVCDADAVAQLFSGGYRSQISKLAISAKDLQNVPAEMRTLLKMTIVALSPIELSIARDVAMRLEAPGFVGEALLVAKKMGYLHYLTTYRNIPRNYKDVDIIETSSLRPRTGAEPGESADGLISFD